MKVEQFVMAYGVEQDRLRAVLPDGFMSLRPVLRVNAEARDERTGYVEFNNIGYWDAVPFTREGKTVTFRTELLDIRFTGVGIEGSCPAEKNNADCFFPGRTEPLRAPEAIASGEEFCDCTFRWKLADGAHGVSIGKTLPAYPTEVSVVYPKEDFTVENAAKIPCRLNRGKSLAL